MDYNHKIDSIKFLCSIAVVIIHLTVFIPAEGLATLENYYIYRPLLNIAVPFYFTTTGYFLGSRSNIEYFKGYAKKTFNLYIFFSITYLLLKIFLVFFDRVFQKKAFWSNVRNIFDGMNLSEIFKGTFGSFHLWYLAALVLAVLLLIFFSKFKLTASEIFIVSIVLYSLDLLNMVDMSPIIIYGGFPKGFFYLSLGYFIYHKSINIKYPLIFFLLSIILYTLNSIYSVTRLGVILLALSTFFLFYFCVKYPGEKTLLSKLGKHSMKIYILHIFVYQFYYKILNVLNITGYRDSLFDLFITTIVCIIFSILLYKPLEYLLQKYNKIVRNIFNY